MSTQELEKNKVVTTRKKATTELPEATGVDFTPQYSRFEYQPGQSVMDVLQQGRRQGAVIEDQQARAQRLSKIAAFSNFVNSLAGLAGGGNGVVKEQQTPAYLQQAFSEVDRLRNQKLQSDMYYDDLARKTKQAEYEQQFKAHNEREKERNKYGYEQAKITADQRFKANMEKFKAGLQDERSEYINPKERNAKLANDSRRLDLYEQRTNAYVDGKNSDPKYTGKRVDVMGKNGKNGYITETNARRIINHMRKLNAEVSEKIKNDRKYVPTELEKVALGIDYSSVFLPGKTQNWDSVHQAVAEILEKDHKGYFNNYVTFDNAGNRSKSGNAPYQPNNEDSWIDDLLMQTQEKEGSTKSGQRDYLTNPSLLK